MHEDVVIPKELTRRRHWKRLTYQSLSNSDIASCRVIHGEEKPTKTTMSTHAILSHCCNRLFQHSNLQFVENHTLILLKNQQNKTKLRTIILPKCQFYAQSILFLLHKRNSKMNKKIGLVI